ncbi:hypothetical protein BaRGS_00033822, partial [Batillaria attramentaria]
LCIDLTSGIVNGTVSSANGFAWYSALTSSSSPCTRQGVLKLTFNNSTRKRAEIFMRFSNSTDWSFNDSDAEVHSRSRTILFYGKGIPGSWYGHLYSGQDFIDDAVTLNVADELAVANNGNDLLYFNTYKTFALNGQADSEGPINYDVYLGMNRVIAGSYRSASLAFEWTASSPDDGEAITACIGDKVTFPWQYTVGEDELVVNTEWHQITDEEPVLAAHTSGYFLKSPHLKMNVQFLPNAGIQISNYTWADFATYRVTVKYTQNNVLKTASRSVVLALPDAPVVAGDRLVAHLQPEPVIDKDTGNRHVQLTCGQFMSIRNLRPESVAWRDPSQAERCATSAKMMLALKRGAHIQVDEVKARMMLLGGEVKGLQVKDVQKDAELKRQREVDSNLLSNDESLASELDIIQDEVTEQNATDKQLTSHVLRLEEEMSLQEETDNNHTEELADLSESEQTLQSTVQTLKADVKDLRNLLQQAESKWAANIKEVDTKCTADIKQLNQQDTEMRSDIATITQSMNLARKSISFHAKTKYVEFSAGDTIFPGEVYTNEGNGFNATTGVFTAPLNGIYIFIFNGAASYASPSKKNVKVHLKVDNKIVNTCITSYHEPPGIYVQGSCHAVVKLRVGQKVKLITESSSKFGHDPYFSGALLHADAE